MFRLGLIINPVAGIGGAVGLKGSDGMVAEALARGAVPKARERARQALLPLCELTTSFELLTVAGEMGETLAAELGLPHRIVGLPGRRRAPRIPGPPPWPCAMPGWICCSSPVAMAPPVTSARRWGSPAMCSASRRGAKSTPGSTG